MLGQEKECIPKAKYKLYMAIGELLSVKEFDDITISDICQLADVSRTTFYRSFQDKYDLVMQWINFLVLQSADVYKGESMQDYFDELLSTVYSLHLREKPLKPLLSVNGNNELKMRIYTRAVPNIAEYYREFLNCDTSSKLPEMLAVFISVGITAIINWVVANNFPVPKETLVSYLVHITEQNPLFLSS